MADVFEIFKWFDVGADWRLGIDRFIKCCAVVLVINWLLGLLYILPADDSKQIINFLISKNPL